MFIDWSELRTVRADEGHGIPLGGEFICGFAQGFIKGTGEAFIQEQNPPGLTETRITVRLVQ
jgi:hypothetical protein